MDHNEINLDVKQTNRRHSTGRYGINTNKTVKKHPIHTVSANKAAETISTLDVDESAPLTRHNYFYGFLSAPVSLGVSLNKRKNWETVHNLKKSQDDINVGYRIVEIDNYTPKGDSSRRVVGNLKMQLYRLDKAPAKDEKGTQIESGVNRKGHFVREKRKKGKKGVKNYNSNSNNRRNNYESNSSSDSNSSSGSESDKNFDEESGEQNGDYRNYTLYIVQKRIKNPASIRSGPFYGCTCTRTCHCGKELGTRRRRDIAQEIASLNINLQ